MYLPQLISIEIFLFSPQNVLLIPLVQSEVNLRLRKCGTLIANETTLLTRPNNM